MTTSRIKGALVALAAAGALIAAPAAVAVPDLPHLVPLLPTIVSADQTAPVFVDPLEQPGHLLYRFDSVIKNTGGALDLFALSPSSATGQNAVTQALWEPGSPSAIQDPNADPSALPGVTAESRPGATMFYDPNPGHHHWHFLQAAEYTLLVPNAPPRGSGKVVGFCMHDSYDFNLGAPSYYPEGYSGSNPDTNRTWCQYFQSPLAGGADPPIVRGGISPGWGDLYESQDAGQWIDVTGLTPGTYTLRNAVNPDGFMKAEAPVNGDDVMEEPRVIPGVTVPALTQSVGGGQATPIGLSGSIVGPEIPARVSNAGSCDDEHLAPTTPLADCYRAAQAGGPLTFALAQAPTHGNVIIASGAGLTGTATYTPAAGYSGPDSFTYTATDARGLTSMPATASLTVTSAQCKKIPARSTTKGDPAGVTLSAKQLLINQRIAQAAVRRVNAVQVWLDAGLTTDDLCGGAFVAQSFASTVRVGSTSTVAPDASQPPSPRPVTSAKPRSGNVKGVTVSARQLLIGQRISQAAVRRANALTQRLDGGLTGGDLRSGVVTPAKLAVGLTVLSSSPGGDPAKSKTVVAPPSPRSGPSGVTLSAKQLLINQRIAQAAVRRSNALIDRLAAGFSAADFQPATVTQRNLGPALLP